MTTYLRGRSQSFGLLLIAAAVVAAACGGGDEDAADPGVGAAALAGAQTDEPESTPGETRDRIGGGIVVHGHPCR